MPVVQGPTRQRQRDEVWRRRCETKTTTKNNLTFSISIVLSLSPSRNHKPTPSLHLQFFSLLSSRGKRAFKDKLYGGIIPRRISSHQGRTALTPRLLGIPRHSVKPTILTQTSQPRRHPTAPAPHQSGRGNKTRQMSVERVCVWTARGERAATDTTVSQ